jgi:hypothetical protein
MSKKYVPSFIRDSSTTASATAATAAIPVATALTGTNELPWSTAKPTSRYSNYPTATDGTTNATNATAAPTYQSRFAGGGVVNKNKFSTLSDDHSSMPPLPKPSSTAAGTSVVSGTLASLTANTNTTTSGAKLSYAAKFSQQAKTDKYPSSKPAVVEKKVDVTSESEFPSLGGGKSTIPKNNSAASLASNKSSSSANTGGSTNKFADLAKGWAQKTKEDEEAAAFEAELKRQQKEEYDSLRSMIRVPGFKPKKKDQYVSPDDMEEEYNRYNGDDYIGSPEEDDSVPSADEEEEEQYEEDDNLENEGQGDDYWR